MTRTLTFNSLTLYQANSIEIKQNFFGLIVLSGIILGPQKCNRFVEIRLGLAVRPKSVIGQNFVKFRGKN